MSVVVSVADVGPCRKQLTVEVPAPEVEAETRRVVAEYGQRARIPGFRKGKVPRDLVRKRYQQEIEREVVDRLLPRYWRQAQEESSIDPLLPPEVDEVRDLAPGAPLTFVATVETRPRIELRNIRDFDLPNPSVDPGTVEVDDAVEEMRRQFGTWVPVERPAARGDLVAAELVESVPGEGAQDREGELQAIEVELGDPRVWEELTLALSGLAAGQETTFSRGEGEGEHAHEHHFRVRVQEVKERELPALDEAFVGRVAPNLETVDALREAVVRQIRQAKEQQRREQRERALVEQLRERHPLELPQGVVRQELERLLRDYAENLVRRGVDLEHSGIDWARVREEMTPLAERRVHARLLLDAIAEAGGVEVAGQELETALATLARVQRTTTSALRKALSEDGRLDAFREQLRRDKTIRRLLAEEVTEAAEAPQTEEASEA